MRVETSVEEVIFYSCGRSLDFAPVLSNRKHGGCARDDGVDGILKLE
jgi:hypothetical protein